MATDIRYLMRGQDVRAERYRRQPVISQIALARRAGLGSTAHTLISIENGRIPLDDDLRRRIAQAFDEIDRERRG